MKKVDIPYPLLDRISDYVTYYCDNSPDVEALVLGNIRLTYKDLNDYVDKIAKALIASGVKKGDRVATLSPPNPDFFAIFLATSSIGAIWVGLNPRYQLNEYQYVVGDCGPKIILSVSSFSGRDYKKDLDVLKEEHQSLEEIVFFNDKAGSFCDFLSRADLITNDFLSKKKEAVKGEDPALIVYTSGSTGKPKGAILPHKGLTKGIYVNIEYNYCHPLKTVNYLPINHIGCVGDISSFALISGGTTVFMENFAPEDCLKLIEKEKLTWFGTVPTAFQMCLDAQEEVGADLSSVKMALFSGASAPKSLLDKLLDIFPVVSSAYGMTETIGSITFVPPCRDSERLANTIGKPTPDYEVMIQTSEGKPAKVGEIGEILTRNPFTMIGYWNNEQATAETIDEEGWLHTGDLAELLEDGSYKLIGRMKEMFISGGYNIYPREIENALEEHPSVAMAAVIHKEDQMFGEVGIAYILLEQGQSLEAINLKEFIKTKLANYKIPKEFFIETELPMLPIGKIDKNALKETRN